MDVLFVNVGLAVGWSFVMTTRGHGKTPTTNLHVMEFKKSYDSFELRGLEIHHCL